MDTTRPAHDAMYAENGRVGPGGFYVLEDKRNRVAPVEHDPERMLASLASVAPAGVADPVIVVLMPGASNSAHFEHAFLAESQTRWAPASRTTGRSIPASPT